MRHEKTKIKTTEFQSNSNVEFLFCFVCVMTEQAATSSSSSSSSSSSVLKQLDRAGTHCLNESRDHSLQGLLAGTSPLESADDAQLLLTLAFREPTKCMRIVLETSDDGRAPRTLKLFANTPNIDFAQAEDEKPTQTFILVSVGTAVAQQADDGAATARQVAYTREANGKLRAELPLYFVRFQQVTHLSMLVEDNAGDADTSLLHALDVLAAEKVSLHVSFAATEAQFGQVLSDAGDKTVFVDFTAGWCGPCKKIAPVFQALSESTPEATFVKVDVDANSAVAKKYSVESMPTFIAFKRGQKVAQMSGANEPALRKFVADHK
jgi:thioredoxin 1